MPLEARDLAAEFRTEPAELFLAAVRLEKAPSEVDEAFRFVFSAWSPGALRIARLYGEPMDAEDAVQEAFVKFWDAAEKGALKSAGDGGNPKAWFFRTLTNESKALAGKRTIEMKKSERIEDETKELVRLGYDPDAQYLYMDKLARDSHYAALLRVAFLALGEQERDLVRRRYALRQSYATIQGEYQEKSLPALRQELRRIRLRLRSEIERAVEAADQPDE